MDYYKKYLKYKAKYLYLKEQIGSGNGGLNETCKKDNDCNQKKFYCSEALLTKNTCQKRKKKGGNCKRDEQCQGTCKSTNLSGEGTCT